MLPQDSEVAPADIAWPRDFGARYGDGVHRGLSLGGGGLFFIAWQVSYIRRLAEEGVHLGGADRVVGTSAGSVVATSLAAGRLTRIGREVSFFTKIPGLLGAIAPTTKLSASQLRAIELFRTAPDADNARIRAIGHAALAAGTANPAVLARNIGLLLGVRGWPSSALHISCVDTYTGERCIVTEAAGVPAARAAAASSAVPGLFSPQLICDRRCMDGGVSGTGTHLDVLGGAKRALVLSLSDGHDVLDGLMTTAPGSIEQEHEQLARTGTDMELRTPAHVDPEQLMSPAALPEAVAMGTRQAGADARTLRSFWR